MLSEDRRTSRALERYPPGRRVALAALPRTCDGTAHVLLGPAVTRHDVTTWRPQVKQRGRQRKRAHSLADSIGRKGNPRPCCALHIVCRLNPLLLYPSSHLTLSLSLSHTQTRSIFSLLFIAFLLCTHITTHRNSLSLFVTSTNHHFHRGAIYFLRVLWIILGRLVIL